MEVRHTPNGYQSSQKCHTMMLQVDPRLSLRSDLFGPTLVTLSQRHLCSCCIWMQVKSPQAQLLPLSHLISHCWSINHMGEVSQLRETINLTTDHYRFAYFSLFSVFFRSLNVGHIVQYDPSLMVREQNELDQYWARS